MHTLRRLTLLGLFAAVGVATAIGVGYSTPQPLDHQAAVVTSAASASQPETPPRPKSIVIAPSGPQRAPIHPAHRQQFRPTAIKDATQPTDDPLADDPLADKAKPVSQPSKSTLRQPSSAVSPSSSGRTFAQAPGEILSSPSPAQPPLPPTSPRPPHATAPSNGAAAHVEGEGDDRFTIDLQDADIRDVLLSLGEQGNLNILLNDSVTGKVSATLKNVDIEQALNAVLKSTGFAARHEGDFILIGKRTELEDPAGKLRTQVFHARHVNVQDLRRLIEWLTTPEVGVVSVWKSDSQLHEPGTDAQAPDPSTTDGVLLVRDYESVLKEIGEMVKKLDEAAADSQTLQAATAKAQATADGLANVKGSLAKNSTGEGDDRLSMSFHDEDIRKVLRLLGEQTNTNILASANVQGTVSAQLHDVDLDSALNAILKSNGFNSKREGDFVYVGTTQDFQQLEQALDNLATRVYRPNYVTAAELEALVKPLLTPEVGVVSVSTPAEVGIGSDEAAVGGDNYAGSDVLVVRDYQATLAQIDQMVREVDIRPIQIHIEAMILSVKLKDTDKYGVSFQLLRQNNNLKFGIGDPASTLADFKFENGALKVGFLDSTLGAFLEALETVGDTNLVAAPSVMVLNKHRAEIQIGDQKGYISTTVTETTATQTVEFLELGTILRLRPFVSSDGLIRMEIHPELSTGDVRVEGDFTIPEKSLTQVTSNIMVRDGATVVIGGLIREELETKVNQVPLVGNLPWLGMLFRDSEEITSRNEILVVITPHIVYDPDKQAEGDRATCEFLRRQSVALDKTNWLNKRNLGRRYFRLAQNAWAAGDRTTALRMAEWAVQYDPLNRRAIDLRADIWQGNCYGAHTACPPPTMPAGVNPLDGNAMPDWLLSELEQGSTVQGSTAQGAPLHPFDPGQPGRQLDLEQPRKLQ